MPREEQQPDVSAGDTWFRAAAEAAGDAIIGADEAGRIVFWNAAAETMFGLPAAHVLGQPLTMLMPERLRAAHSQGLERVIRTGERRLLGRPVELEALRADGSEFLVELSVTRGSAPSGGFFVAVLRDITVRKAQAEALRRTEEILRLTIDHAPIGMALVAPDGRFVRVNRALCRMLGYGSDELVRLTFQDITHPDDLVADITQVERLLRGEIESYQLAKRYHHRGGSTVEVKLHVSLVRDRAGQPLHFIAQIEDVTEARKVELALREQTALVQLLEAVAAAANQAPTSRRAMHDSLRLVCDFMGWPVGHAYLVDGAELLPSDIWHITQRERFGLFRDVTSRSRLSAGLDLPGQVLATGKPCWMEDVQSNPAFLRARAAHSLGVRGGFAFPVLIGEEVIAVLEFYSERRAAPDGRTLEVMQHVGAQLGRVAERERHAEAVRGLSLTDELTGLCNRRGFMASAEPQLRSAARARRSCLVLFVDMDGLKQINDQLGHEVGDAALLDLARILRSTLRDSDILARLGGDEFVALLPDASTTNAAAVSQRLQEALALYNIAQTRAYVLSVSIGASIFDPAAPKALEALIREADGLMYEQKRRRKSANRSSVITPGLREGS